MQQTEALTRVADGDFAAIWRANEMTAGHPAIEAGFVALDRQFQYPETAVSRLRFTDVTLRDGQQQQTNKVSTRRRIEVFDTIVATGVDQIEIGHLGNKKGDQQLAVALVKHLAEREQADERYKNVKLQVLFGSQAKEITEGSQLLRAAFQKYYPETWQREIAERVVVHVYDRVDPNLLATASEPYTIRDSALRIGVAAMQARAAGFQRFSLSGEATTAITPEESIQFFRTITQQLLDSGATAVNINLANTYGYSVTKEWNTATMAIFNAAVKHGFGDKVTTSIHAHNDVDNAIAYTASAVVAGVDRVEGTLIGVGERTGNTANIDVLAWLLEQARHQTIREQRAAAGINPSLLAQRAGNLTLQRTVSLDPSVITNLHTWHPAGTKLAQIFGRHAMYRWQRTAAGNPYAHDNGSGPHDQVMAAAITNPLQHPGDSGYEWALLTHHALGRPETEDIAIGDPDAVDSITVGNHAGGGKTLAIKQGSLERASATDVTQARIEFRARNQALLEALLDGVTVVSI